MPASIPLDEFHDVIQMAMGSTDSHLHMFQSGDIEYMRPYDEPLESNQRTEFGIPLERILSTTGNSIRYLYDFGDSWFHDVERLRCYGFTSETVFPELLSTRIAMEEADLIRRVRGKFTVTKFRRQPIARSGLKEVYPPLMREYLLTLNWSYISDHYEQSRLIQKAFPFTLYLLHKYGDEWRPLSFYETAFLAAFPEVLKGFGEYQFTTREQQFRSCYSYRCFRSCGPLFGLIETDVPYRVLGPSVQAIGKSSLLDTAVKFGLKN